MKSVNMLCGLLAAGFLLALMSGCASPGPAASSQSIALSKMGADDIAEMNQTLLAQADGSQEPGDYLLGTGDLIEVTVFEDASLNTTARVSARGYIRLPLLNQLCVQGMTVRETEALVEALYREKYLNDPHVGIFVKEHFSQRITMVGAFQRPGTYDYYAKQRLTDVLALAGGLADNAGKTAQIRRRKIAATDPPDSWIVDLDRLIGRGETALNIEINGGDTIFVPEAGVYFVDGAVRHPGNYPIKHETSIHEALLATGGFMPYADKSRLQLIRYLGEGERKIIDLDLDENGWETMMVQDRDVIVASTSAWGKLVHGLGLNLGGGLLGVGVGYHSPER